MGRTGIYDLHDGFIPDDDCPQEKPKQTNADRIRAMSDEELAHFMARVCPPGGKCNEGGNCFACRLDWLKSPVEEVQDG